MYSGVEHESAWLEYREHDTRDFDDEESGTSTRIIKGLVDTAVEVSELFVLQYLFE